ncbi:MAG: hypothetical protein JSV91_09190 [Phycisphaerales bacterium]|nr:MAG: hypothetical protein JSV91_09190 [Phycisphaerales bacterium]
MIYRSLAAAAIVAIPATAASGEVLFYGSEADFLTQMSNVGYLFEGLEDFEGNNVGPGNVLALPGPLEFGTPWVDDLGNGFPTGLSQPNLAITCSGVDPDNWPVLLTDGFAGAVTDCVGANTFAESTNLNFVNGMTGGVSLVLFDLINGGNADVAVYDVNDTLLATGVASAPFNGAFLGVYSDVAIGRINIQAQNTGGEILDNVSMYNIPAPASLGLLALAGLARRRRR